MLFQNGAFDLSIAPHERIIAVAAYCLQICRRPRWIDGVLQARKEAAGPHRAHRMQLLGRGEVLVHPLAVVALMRGVATSRSALQSLPKQEFTYGFRLISGSAISWLMRAVHQDIISSPAWKCPATCSVRSLYVAKSKPQNPQCNAW